MKKLLFIVMMLFAAGFAFSQQNQAPRNASTEEGVVGVRPSPALGQLGVDAPQSAEDADIKAMLQKNEDFFNDFQNKFKTLRTYNNTKQDRDNAKLMQTMIDRQKKMIQFKMEEIEILERGGKTVPVSEFSQLKELMDRYHQMSVDLSNWVNKVK